MERINTLVGYNNIKIIQNDDWFKFSLESVLLPNFVKINLRYKNIMDLCTGNAPIPLLLSLRTKAKIVGVEIQKDVFELAKKTIEINNLENQIKIINEDLKNLKKIYDGDNFDLITVNPPYFKNPNKKIMNDDLHKMIARHELDTPLEEIIKISKFLLKNGGHFAMVHRTERFFEIIDILKKHNLIPKWIKLIYPKVNEKSNLFMVECIKNGKSEVEFDNPLYIHNSDGTYKDEIKRIFNVKEGVYGENDSRPW